MEQDKDIIRQRFQDSETFCQILFEAFYASHGTGCTYYSINWRMQYLFAKNCKLLSVTLPVVKRLSEEIPMHGDLLARWEQEAKQEQEYGLKQGEIFGQFMKAAHRAQISFVVFKGPILAQLYPKAGQRISSDTDIFVEKEHEQNVLQFLAHEGYVFDASHSEEQVPVYVNPKTGHRVEVHFSLWENHSGPRVQLLEECKITDPETFVTVDVDGIPVTTLGYHEHLLYQLYHLIKHLMVEGTTFRTLLDISLFLSSYREFIDFPLLWKQLDRLGFQRMVEVIVHTCVRYFYLDRQVANGAVAATYNDYFYLLVSLSNRSAGAADDEDFAALCEFLDPYVSGEEDLQREEEVQLDSSLSEEFKQKVDARVTMLHHFHLTSKEKDLPPVADIAEGLFLSEEERRQAKANAKYFYRAYGLTIASEIEMYELFTQDKDQVNPVDADVYVHYCPTIGDLSNPKLKRAEPGYYWMNTGACRFIIRDYGKEIIVDKIKAETREKDLKAYIISHAMVYCLYMRGIPTLHSSTVGLDGRAITIMGDCGAGKSTYSTLLRHEGYKLVADDISAVTVKDGQPYVQLAVPQQKYTVDTAQKEGLALEDLECVEEKRGKYRLLLSEQDMCEGPTPMKGIFEIYADAVDNRLEFIKLEGLDALQALACYMFNQSYSNAMGGVSVEAFQALLSIAQTVPFYKIIRPTDRDARQEILQFILDHSK